MSDWVKFYDFKHSVIYVNARHRDVHYRKIAEDMALGETTLGLSHKYPISQGRISQLRRELHRDWLRFHGESVPPTRPA